MICGVASPSRRARACRRRETRSRAARRARSRSTSTSGEAARAFITLTSVCPPASARAPSCSARRRDRLLDGGRPRVLDLAQKHAADQAHESVTCQARTSRGSVAAMAYDAVFVGSGINSLAGAALLAKSGWQRAACSSAPTGSAAAIWTSSDLTAPGLHARGAGLLAPALDRLAGLRRAEARPRPARGRVPQHRPPDRHRLPGRLGRLPDDLARGERRRARAPRRRRRRRVAAAVRRVHGERRPRFGVLGTELWSAPASRSAGRRYRRFGRRGLLEFAGGIALDLPRLGRRRRSASEQRARPARALGAAHRPRARPGDVRAS